VVGDERVVLLLTSTRLTTKGIPGEEERRSKKPSSSLEEGEPGAKIHFDDSDDDR
jgi:hypothetical protein